MAAEITREELLLLGRCPFFRGADEALLRRVLALPGVTATVNLEAGTAAVQGDVSDEVLTKAVTDAGYEVVEIK